MIPKVIWGKFEGPRKAPGESNTTFWAFHWLKIYFKHVLRPGSSLGIYGNNNENTAKTSCLDRALPAVAASKSHCSLARTGRSTRKDGPGPSPTDQNCQTFLCSWWCSWQLQSARWPRKPFQPVRTEAAVGVGVSMYSLVTIWKSMSEKPASQRVGKGETDLWAWNNQ